VNINNENQPTKHDESSKDNLVHDLKKSLKEVIDETTAILGDLEQTVESTIKDQSISDTTKEIVDAFSDEIKNSKAGENQKIINTSKIKKPIDNLEEE
jgi:hypothetical protein